MMFLHLTDKLVCSNHSISDDYEAITKCPLIRTKDRQWLNLIEALVDQQAMPDDFWKREALSILGIDTNKGMG